MHIDIAATIREVLDDMHAVSITGIGTMQLKHISAYFSDNGTTLSPPQMVLDINDSITTNTPLIEAIASNYGITKVEAENVITKFNKKLLTHLVNYKKVYLKGIALIKRTDKGNVDVEPISKDLYNYHIGLPKVKVSSVIKTQKPTVERNSSAPLVALPLSKSSSTKQNDIKDPKPYPKPTTNSIPNYAAPKKNISAPSTYVTPGNHVTRSPKPKVDSVEPEKRSTIADNATTKPLPVYQYEAKKPSILWPLIMLISLILIALLCYRACSYYATSGSKYAGSQSEINIEEVDALDGVMATDSISAEALSTLRNDNGGILPISGNCKIITGVFSRSVNTLRMKDRVRNAGYEAYTESLGAYTRVGLIFNCDEETDLESFLQDVRREIAAKAWYLDPSLYVEYE